MRLPRGAQKVRVLRERDPFTGMRLLEINFNKNMSPLGRLPPPSAPLPLTLDP